MEKSEIWFFCRFSRFHIIHVNLSTFENKIGKNKFLFKNIRTFLNRQKFTFFFLQFFFSNQFFFHKCLNSNERCGIDWIERKIKLQIFPILVFELWSFMIIFIPNFRWIFHDNSKSKNRKLILHSFQHILHHPWKLDQNSGGVCIS